MKAGACLLLFCLMEAAAQVRPVQPQPGEGWPWNQQPRVQSRVDVNVGQSGGAGTAGGSAGGGTHVGGGVYVDGSSKSEIIRGSYYSVVPKGSLMPRAQARYRPAPAQLPTAPQNGNATDGPGAESLGNSGNSGENQAADPAGNTSVTGGLRFDAPATVESHYNAPAMQRWPGPLPVQRRQAPAHQARPKPSGPRLPSVYESSGPLYGEVDDLVEYQRAQAAKGNPQSQFALGMRYLSGNGVIQNDQIAREWLEKASQNGELRAREKLRELRRNRSNTTE